MKLEELFVTPGTQLSQAQKECLLKMYVAQSVSPDAAADTIKGNDQLMAAAEFLLTNGYISHVGNGFTVTQTGVDALVNSGLVDTTGKVTADGRNIVDAQSAGVSDINRSN